MSRKRSSASGLASASLFLTVRPCTTSRTASSVILPDFVRGMSATATILLRPFGFNTLATFVYENASRGVVEDGAIAALLIIATALAPVILLSRALMRDREAEL